MRWVYLGFLVVVCLAITVFALQNRDDVTLTVYGWTITGPAVLVLGATYVLGMLTGWSVVGVLRRTIRRATGAPQSPA
jgi:lipopolysaccharide assembly protein A